MTRLVCPYARAVVERALAAAPDLDPHPPSGASTIVIGGLRDRVVPPRWVRDTAARHGVAARFVSGGHRVMHGRAADEAMRTLAC